MEFVESCFMLVFVLESQRRFAVLLAKDSLKPDFFHDSPVTSDPSANSSEFLNSVDEPTFVVELDHFRNLFNKNFLSEFRIAEKIVFVVLEVGLKDLISLENFPYFGKHIF